MNRLAAMVLTTHTLYVAVEPMGAGRGATLQAIDVSGE
jgi:hypothetical protein